MAAAMAQAEEDAPVYGPTPLITLAQRLPSHSTAQAYSRDGERTVLLHSPGRTTELEYNANGQVIAKTSTRDGEKYTYRYEWNARGELVSVTTPNGKVWTYTYDGAGRRIEKRSPVGDVWRYVWMGHEFMHTVLQDVRGDETVEVVETYVHEPSAPPSRYV
jgi:YD repeat-containing protein